jgi:putative cell wall-binding protein
MGICERNNNVGRKKKIIDDENNVKGNDQNNQKKQKKNNNDLTHKGQNSYKPSSGEDIIEGLDNYANYAYNQNEFQKKNKIQNNQKKQEKNNNDLTHKGQNS